MAPHYAEPLVDRRLNYALKRTNLHESKIPAQCLLPHPPLMGNEIPVEYCALFVDLVDVRGSGRSGA